MRVLTRKIYIMTIKIIPQRYFAELKERGNTVPRDEQTGETMIFKVGAILDIRHEKNGETIIAKCTQDSPCNLRLINPEDLENYYIFQDGIIKHSFLNQPTDEKVFGWLLRNQHASTHRALTVDGWKIEIENKHTGVVTNYTDGKIIKDPLFKRLTDEV